MKQSVYGKTFQGTFGPMTRIPDFLPPPEYLVHKHTSAKITLTLEPSTIAFFKAQAIKLGSSYQRMIRNLLDQYVQNQLQQQSGSSKAASK